MNLKETEHFPYVHRVRDWLLYEGETAHGARGDAAKLPTRLYSLMEHFDHSRTDPVMAKPGWPTQLLPWKATNGRVIPYTGSSYTPRTASAIHRLRRETCMLERNLIATSARSHTSPACQKSGALIEQIVDLAEALSCVSATRLHRLTQARP